MEDARNSVLGYSEKVLAKLKLLSVFFGDATVLHIYARTQVIHNSFRDNPELDIHKLELFHLQFTDTIIDLLRKLKKGNENRVVQAEDEIAVNEDLIRTLTDASQLAQSFETATFGHTHALNKAVNGLYENLSDYSRSNPFPALLRDFSAHYASDFFYEVSPVFFDSLLDHDPARLYRNGYGSIEKKLMGLQCKHGFKNDFFCGVREGERVAELYKLQDFIEEDDDHEYFVFDPAKNFLHGINSELVKQVPREGNISKKAETIFGLQETNVQIRRRLPAMRTGIPEGLTNLLADYQRRIDAIDFLEMIDKYDIQANILKTMLNTDTI